MPFGTVGAGKLRGVATVMLNMAVLETLLASVIFTENVVGPEAIPGAVPEIVELRVVEGVGVSHPGRPVYNHV
jgi:hypothetical protein